MLIPETPFPQVGSYALYVDPDATDRAAPGLELVRLLERRGDFTMVAFPLRDGASGNKVVAHAELLNAAPLTAAEQMELKDLDRYLAGRTSFTTPKQKAAKARWTALKLQIIHGPIMDRQLRFARARVERRAA